MHLGVHSAFSNVAEKQNSTNIQTKNYNSRTERCTMWSGGRRPDSISGSTPSGKTYAAQSQRYPLPKFRGTLAGRQGGPVVIEENCSNKKFVTGTYFIGIYFICTSSKQHNSDIVGTGTVSYFQYLLNSIFSDFYFKQFFAPFYFPFYFKQHQQTRYWYLPGT